MGFYITKIGGGEFSEYIGSQTMYSCADNGAFDSPVSPKFEKIANEDEAIFAIVDKDGVEHFLSVLKSGTCVGRDVEKFIETVENNFQKGFIMRG